MPALAYTKDQELPETANSTGNKSRQRDKTPIKSTPNRHPNGKKITKPDQSVESTSDTLPDATEYPISPKSSGSPKVVLFVTRYKLKNGKPNTYQE